jgi:hypothetical protein
MNWQPIKDWQSVPGENRYVLLWVAKEKGYFLGLPQPLLTCTDADAGEETVTEHGFIINMEEATRGWVGVDDLDVMVLVPFFTIVEPPHTERKQLT